jgi:hypothetical protein
MKWFDRWKKIELDDKLQEFELKLDYTLSSVEPRPEFVAELRKNLMQPNFEIDLVPESQNQRLQTGILLTGGILSVVFMVLAGVRGVISVIGTIGLLISFVRQNANETPTPTISLTS